MDFIEIGDSREFFWDDCLVDTTHTTAGKRMHRPERREVVLRFDRPWEGSHCYFINMFRDGSKMRMYYHASANGCTDDVRICYAESVDGIRWEKPELGLCEYNGSRKNNILLDKSMVPGVANPISDNMFVFRDSNPDCPEDERYKGVCCIYHNGIRDLKCFISPDGIRFRYGWEMCSYRLFFDSLNTAFYDPNRKRYLCYLRGWHEHDGRATEKITRDSLRDIRVMESEDFRHWTTPVPLDFGAEAPDFHLYTNNVEPYDRSDRMLVGFPARYTDRYQWTANYERLCGKSERTQRIRDQSPRFGYTVTDCLFMCSRDGKNWMRTDEAFLRPGPENDWSWRYGDCFMNAGMFETPSAFPGEAPELSFLSPTKRWTDESSGNLLVRYALRVDGFISRYAGFSPEVLLTKPFLFRGDRLTINFETSAAGSVFVELTDRNGKVLNEFRSCELFGNSIDRTVDFEGKLSELNGMPVRLRFTLSDADVYAFRFGSAPKEQGR